MPTQDWFCGNAAHRLMATICAVEIDLSSQSPPEMVKLPTSVQTPPLNNRFIMADENIQLFTANADINLTPPW